MDIDWSFPQKRYSASWKRFRRLFAQYINSPAAKISYSSRQMSSAHTLLRELLRSPEELDASIRHAIGNVLLGMAYGFDVQPSNDPHVKIAERLVKKIITGINPTKFLVNIVPWRECSICIMFNRA